MKPKLIEHVTVQGATTLEDGLHRPTARFSFIRRGGGIILPFYKSLDSRAVFGKIRKPDTMFCNAND